MSCQASHLHQLVQEISKLAEVIYNLGISTHQGRKLLTFLPGMSAHQMFNFFCQTEEYALEQVGTVYLRWCPFCFFLFFFVILLAQGYIRLRRYTDTQIKFV